MSRETQESDLVFKHSNIRSLKLTVIQRTLRHEIILVPIDISETDTNQILGDVDCPASREAISILGTVEMLVKLFEPRAVGHIFGCNASLSEEINKIIFPFK